MYPHSSNGGGGGGDAVGTDDGQLKRQGRPKYFWARRHSAPDKTSNPFNRVLKKYDMFHNQFCHVVHSKAQFYLNYDISTSFYARYINLKLNDNPRHNIQSWHPPFPPLIERPFQARHLCAPDARGVTGRPGRPLPYIRDEGPLQPMVFPSSFSGC